MAMAMAMAMARAGHQGNDWSTSAPVADTHTEHEVRTADGGPASGP